MIPLRCGYGDLFKVWVRGGDLFKVWVRGGDLFKVWVW